MEPRHRDALPQLGDEPFLTDGGIETTLTFHQGLELPELAAFDLLKDDAGVAELRRYFDPYLELARSEGAGFILETPTWRASPRWASAIGYDEAQLDGLNRQAVELMEELRAASEAEAGTMVISGCVGPQDDAYDPARMLSPEEAGSYHSTQISTFADTSADLVTAITMTHAEEAIGIARAAGAAGMPVAISFTLETDGTLPSGQPLAEAIDQVDADPDSEVAYHMINCAHPTHFDDLVAGEGPWRERIRGLRANASTKSHEELDEASELDDGDPEDLGARYAELRASLPALNVLGGCCGTDARHVSAIWSAWTA